MSSIHPPLSFLHSLFPHQNNRSSFLPSSISMTSREGLLALLILLSILLEDAAASDYVLTCPRPIKQKARSGRWLKLQEKVLKRVPCEFNSDQWWCGVPGDNYPWSPLRAFVMENQGLMRRMYGEVRQLNLMRMEFSDTNTIDDYDSLYEESRRSFLDPFSEPAGNRGGTEEPELVDTPPPPTTTTPESVTDGLIPSSEQGESAELLEGTTTGAEAAMTTGGLDPTTPTTSVPAGNSSSGVGEAEQRRAGHLRVEGVSTSSTAKPAVRAVNACPVREEVVAPYWANNTRGEVLALLNLYPFEQYVHWEKCNFEHQQMYCREGCRCEQQFRLHRLLAFDPTNECRGIFSDWFRFPSCCVCKCYLTEMEIQTHLLRSDESQSRSPREFDAYNYNYDFYDDPDVRGVDRRVSRRYGPRK